MEIDWQTSETHLLLNPRMPQRQRESLEVVLQHNEEFKGHIWLCTSGSTALKLVALSKEAILASASAVNQHLKSTSSDIWVNPLPLFHVGGLGIQARGYLSGAKVIDYNEKWNPLSFQRCLLTSLASLTALVPTQIFDLVQQRISAPLSLRGIIVGGGALSEDLYRQAASLGWPLLPSYGMTECASQVATAAIDSPTLQILSHMKVSVNEQGQFCLKSKSLLSAYAFVEADGLRIVDPKVDGAFITQDLGVTDGQFLHIDGRQEDFIKIGGESVHLTRLRQLLEQLMLKNLVEGDVALFPAKDARLGFTIHLASTMSSDALDLTIKEFNIKVMPFEKIRQTHQVAEIPRSPLNKILTAELLKMILNH